jgi:hypothetical protein
MSKMIFVFGSNLAGHHGLGAAKTARLHRGAVMGVAFGLTGSSYAIPTKDYNIRNTLSLSTIRQYVAVFLAEAANQYPTYQFQVTRIGCGLAGLKDEQIAPMFKEAPENCLFDNMWLPWLGNDASYWGTY